MEKGEKKQEKSWEASLILLMFLSKSLYLKYIIARCEKDFCKVYLFNPLHSYKYVVETRHNIRWFSQINGTRKPIYNVFHDRRQKMFIQLIIIYREGCLCRNILFKYFI